MRYILTAKQMQYADKTMIQSKGLPSLVLMERAALKTVEGILSSARDLSDILVVCGSGNNGGDGFAIGRILIEKGYHVDIVFAGKMASRSQETTKQMDVLENLGVEIFTEIPKKEYTVIVDAIFGIGLSRPIEGHYYDVIEKLNQMKGYKVAVDIASGISANNGEVLGIAFRADLTVTFAWEKLGHILYPGCEYSGKVECADIGIWNPGWKEEEDRFLTLDPDDLKSGFPKRKKDSNKGTYGRLLVIAGSKGMSGAAYLSAKAAYLTGAGLVRIYTEESNRTILQQLLPEAILTTYDSTKEDPFKELDSALEWADSICIGCGLGLSDTSKELMKRFLQKNTKKAVIDADGLNIISEYGTEELQQLIGEDRYIFTPHMKEMERLCKEPVSKIKKDRLDILRDFLLKYNITCVLKDSRSFVVHRNKPVYINTSGNSAMAKAGSGDVLAGVIAGLLVQGMDLYFAAVLGDYLHGLAGDEARRECGPYSVLAEDILKGVKMTLKSMEADL